MHTPPTRIFRRYNDKTYNIYLSLEKVPIKDLIKWYDLCKKYNKKYAPSIYRLCYSLLEIKEEIRNRRTHETSSNSTTCN